MDMQFSWARRGLGDVGYECSSKGDKRFSALFATMPDGRTIEQWYQCDIKGYQPGGTDWKLGKGRPALVVYPEGELWISYLFLWRNWSLRHIHLMEELHGLAHQKGRVLTDQFATSNINQANALATILNQWAES
jgi:hypothetical protein